MLLFSFYSCAVLNSGGVKMVSLHQKKGRIVVEDEKYKIFLDETKVIKYLEDKSNKSKDDDEMLLLLTNSNDTLVIKKPLKDLLFQDNNLWVIYDIFYDMLKKGDCAIIEKQNGRYINKIKVTTVMCGKRVEQVNFRIDDELFFCRIYLFCS